MRFPGYRAILFRPQIANVRPSQDPPMMAKPKPPLRLVQPQFAVAKAVYKPSRDDAFVILPIAEFRALVKAASK